MPTRHRGTPAERLALDSYIKLSRAAASAEARINRHLIDHGLTLSQFGVLEALYHLGPMVQTRLAEKILKSSGNMTTVIDNLCKRGLVERRRTPDDRRYAHIHLTGAGSALIAAIFPAHAARVAEVFGALSADECAQLGALCKKLGRSQGDTGVGARDEEQRAGVGS